MRNRRNLYRILHVQPEAPLEVIKASYRSLMTKLRHHPDLGGDHETAALINQAYAVLSDPVKRAEYDRSLPQRRKKASAEDCAQVTQPDKTRQANAGRQPTDDSCCAFCGERILTAIQPGVRCPRCASPLTRVERPRGTPSGRRAMNRMTRSEQIVVYPSWPHDGCRSQLQDLSPIGIRFLTMHDLRIHQVIKVSGVAFEGVGRIVARSLHARSAAPALFSVHARLVAIEFLSPPGVFVSTKV